MYYVSTPLASNQNSRNWTVAPPPLPRTPPYPRTVPICINSSYCAVNAITAVSAYGNFLEILCYNCFTLALKAVTELLLLIVKHQRIVRRVRCYFTCNRRALLLHVSCTDCEPRWAPIQCAVRSTRIQHEPFYFKCTFAFLSHTETFMPPYAFFYKLYLLH